MIMSRALSNRPSMFVPRATVSLLLLLASAVGAVAAEGMSFIEAAERLDGTWEGDGYILRVDKDRAQANVDAQRPFRWQRFLVKEVDGDLIVFTIGPELFEGRLAEDSLTLSSTIFRGERNMARVPAPVAPQ